MVVQYLITIKTDDESMVDPEGVWEYGLEPHIRDFIRDMTDTNYDVVVSYKKAKGKDNK